MAIKLFEIEKKIEVKACHQFGAQAIHEPMPVINMKLSDQLQRNLDKITTKVSQNVLENVVFDWQLYFNTTQLYYMIVLIWYIRLRLWEIYTI